MRVFSVIIGLALTIAVAAAAPAGIQPETLLRHIKFLADDDLKGRGNGTEGLERAGDYIAEQFEAAGLSPGGKDGWFQPFEIIVGLAIGERNSLVVEQAGRRISLDLGSDYYPLAAPANDSAAAPSAHLAHLPLVFAGYGLVVPGARGYDDYAGIDVKGKAVVIFSHEPQEQDSGSRLNGNRPVPQTTLQAKAAAAQARGAAAILVISDPSHQVDDAPYERFLAEPDAENHGIPVLRVKRSEMRPYIEAWGLDNLARQIDSDLVPRSRALPGATIDYEESLTRDRRVVRNVVGVLAGSDASKASEAIVIGAHYDHVGLGGRFSVVPERLGEIHNGADDNASGTAAVMEMARAAASERTRFPRTLVFVAFAGEERGLLGSAQYVQAPSVAAADTIAMLNLDMVGRARGNVDVSGIESAPSIEADLKAAVQAAGVGLDIRRGGPGAGRSDDASFLDKQIPAINFFTGFHDDYHRPSDDWDKIDVPGTTRVAALALELAARLAARPDRPVFTTQRR